MITKIKFSFVWDNYGTYINQKTKKVESHYARVLTQIVLSIILATFVDKLSDDSISVAVTALSILIGFAFAALFPIAYENGSSLPKPLYSEDFDDLRNVRVLTTFFRFNVGYFIPLTLVTITFLIVQMLSISVPSSISHFVIKASRNVHGYKVDWELLGFYVQKSIIAVSTLLLQEACYTFYRMCFNVLALLRIRDEYISSRAARDGKPDV